MLSEPTVTCANCGDVVVVNPDGRSDDPVGVARRKLAKRCRAKGCVCKSRYRVGVRF